VTGCEAALHGYTHTQAPVTSDLEVCHALHISLRSVNGYSDTWARKKWYTETGNGCNCKGGSSIKHQISTKQASQFGFRLTSRIETDRSGCMFTQPPWRSNGINEIGGCRAQVPSSAVWPPAYFQTWHHHCSCL